MTAFFRSRWRGEVPLQTVFWRDMVLGGTGVNLAAALIAMMMFAADGSTVIAAVIYFSPVPYSVFLFASVWRSAERTPGPAAMWAQAAAAVWLILVIVL